MLIAMYDFLGYYSVCYVGGEVRNPERVMPRAIFYSVISIALIYSVMNFSIMSVVPWREARHSTLIVAEFMEKLHGTWAAGTITVLVLWTAFAAGVATLLGYSRIPYAAALDGHFFKSFARLNANHFPHISLLVMGVLSIVTGLVNLEWVVSAMLTGRILIQFIAQIFAVHYLRKYRPDIDRPFKTWLYPLPNAIAFLGWAYIFPDLWVGVHLVWRTYAGGGHRRLLAMASSHGPVSTLDLRVCAKTTWNFGRVLVVGLALGPTTKQTEDDDEQRFFSFVGPGSSIGEMGYLWWPR